MLQSVLSQALFYTAVNVATHQLQAIKKALVYDQPAHNLTAAFQRERMSKTSAKGVLTRLQNEHCEGFVCFAGGMELYPGSRIVAKCNPPSEKMNQEQPGKWRLPKRS